MYNAHVQETYSNCLETRKILQRSRVPFEERDISLSKQFNQVLFYELQLHGCLFRVQGEGGMLDR